VRAVYVAAAAVLVLVALGMARLVTTRAVAAARAAAVELR
jgi:hypothetical protein